ncbi:hypothetical protein [Burkholderia mallei]|uniref:hypothetical protein n=1 Tax=Burkholderia mallei TaxID=13373 RepID=UPI000B0D06FF|nr:hypothetical protein [Burkholderia mallei]WPJ33133.1 hypothetical protein Zagreb_001302 [Burkholderia mallei]WPJ36121.1 hypothetical protein Mukteswar_003720 [Burkholderia mallei]WPJ40923.1 hypothetical protein Bogor_000473 [Burkholderia mallei]
MIFHAARAIVIAPIARKRGPFGRTPSASGAFARRRPGRRGVASRARACEAALAAVARRASSDACPTVVSIRQSRAAARRACEDIAGDPNGRRGGRRRRVGRWGGIGGDNRYRRVGRRAPAVPRLRWAGLRRALGGAWCPPAVGHGGGAPSDGHHVFMHRSSLIAHRSSLIARAGAARRTLGFMRSIRVPAWRIDG